jgi:hypothetical protein
MKNICVFFTCIIFFYSCSQSKVNERYKNDLRKFPSFLIDFFPSNLLDQYVSSMNVDTTSQCIFYQLYVFNPDKTVFNKFRAIQEYNPNDSFLITIKRKTLFDWSYKEKNFYESINRNQRKYFPILFFEKIEMVNNLKKINIFSDVSESGLNKNFKIYVVESKTGNFWHGLKPLDYMPTGFKNGYSKGFCVNEVDNVLIYWFVVW